MIDFPKLPIPPPNKNLFDKLLYILLITVTAPKLDLEAGTTDSVYKKL